VQVSNIFILLANILLIAGSAILISTLFIIQRLFNSLAHSDIRAKKYFLSIPILLSSLGYFGYLITFWRAQHNWHDLITPAILFVSACSLWLACKMSLQPTFRYMLAQGNITDPLTGIYNRRYLEHRLADEIVRAQRYALPLSVFLLDIDQSEKINTTYGRRIADLILIHLAKLLLEYVRESDEVAHYDQGAILVIASNTSMHDAHLLAERIRQRIVAQPLLHAENEKVERIAISISIGVATLQGSFDNIEKLLQRAELALQQAHQAGGNCVVAAEPAGIQNQDA
jgi:diguanylate cyclase (GGDEF)-like protein